MMPYSGIFFQFESGNKKGWNKSIVERRSLARRPDLNDERWAIPALDLEGRN
jgi:hypothetical protein